MSHFVQPLDVIPHAVFYAHEHLATLAPHISELQEVRTPTRAYAAVRRTLDNVQVLAQLGYDAPSPALNTYGFPGRFKPYQHQTETFEFLTRHRKAFVLDDPGLGKTSATIWAVDFLRSAGRIGRVLVLCPLSCVKSVWQRELFNILPNDSVALAIGSLEEKRVAIKSKARWIIMNHDGVKPCAVDLIEDKSITHVIVDEATAFKTYGRGRFRALRAVLGTTRTCWMLTGTPCPQGPWDAWALCRLICPERVPSSLNGWNDLTATKREVRAGAKTVAKWIAKPDSFKIVFGRMQPAIRHTKADCLDLPDMIYVDRDAPLSAEQAKAEKEMLKSFVADMAGGGQVVAQTAAARLSKLLQIYQGCVIQADGSIAELDWTPRMAALLELIENSASSVIVFAGFTGVVERLARELPKHGHTAALINGEVNPTDRDQIVQDFQAGRYKVLCAHPKAMAHGLTLTAASTSVWWGPYFAVETVLQANERMSRPGQKHVMTIAHLVSGASERRSYELVRTGTLTQAALLSLYAEATKQRGRRTP